jgi:hypothetical protein
MVNPLQKVVTAIVRHARGDAPSWASQLFTTLYRLEGKVNLLMAVDTQVVARLVAAAGALAEQTKVVTAERDALKTQLSDEQAADVTSAAQDSASTADINAAADAVLSLVNGPSTPDVTPVPIEDVPGVVDGSTPVTAPDGGDVAEPTDGGVPSTSTDTPVTNGSDVTGSDQF